VSRRITLAILLTVWAMLIAGGGVAYWTTRTLLLADLDDALVGQALSRPELLPTARRPAGSPTALRDGERYVIQNAVDGRRSRPTGAAEGPQPELIGATFSTAGGQRQRTVTVRAWMRPQPEGGQPTPVIVTYTGSAEAFHHLLNRLALTLGGCVLLGGTIAAAVAYRVSSAALRPLRRTAEAIGSIDERRLDRRIDAASLPPELVPMAERLNDMLARLEHAFSQRRQFLADASHELRTPVAALITGLEVTLGRPRTAEAYRATLEDALDESRHLRRLVERLMEQVRSEVPSHDEPPREIDLSALLDECADTTAALGRDRRIKIERDYAPGIRIETQPGRIRSIVQNLLANAVHYNRDGGVVEIRASAGADAIEVRVGDTGRGIPPEQVPHLFEPFYRGDAAHGAAAEGHLGLGLFLVQSHLAALGGRCTVESEVGRGTTFIVRLPAAGPGSERSEAAAVSTASEKAGAARTGHRETAAVMAGSSDPNVRL
jgi:heavy metal sensor kinase